MNKWQKHDMRCWKVCIIL